ncbi:hypothetical protein ACNKW1_13350 [Thauera sp. WH-2]|jgi:drug/metabolite transporter (DMT)-like permease|uniref:hypothetical protein n=1 Tax=Thauera sp. WH-2 TaxID=3401574 RepID=UPI003AAE02D3
MAQRKGEKLGWTWGWIGGFVWVAIVGVVFLAQGQVAAGSVGIGLFTAACWAIRRFAPWRHPTTPYWRLYIVLYVLFFATIPWALWGFGARDDESFNGWMLLMLLPTLTPILIMGRKTWVDGEPGAQEKS